MDTTVLAAAPDQAGYYLDWGVVQISATNLIVILVMLAVFAVALVVPLGRGTRDREGRR
jgi:hypothetical protein